MLSPWKILSSNNQFNRRSPYMHTKRWHTTFKRCKFTIHCSVFGLDTYIINIMSVNSWKLVLKQICGEKHFKNCECCPRSLLIEGSLWMLWVFVHQARPQNGCLRRIPVSFQPPPPRINLSFRWWYMCRQDICFSIFCDISALFFVHLPPHFFLDVVASLAPSPVSQKFFSFLFDSF